MNNQCTSNENPTANNRSTSPPTNAALPWLTTVLCASVLAGLLVAINGLLGGKIMAEKALTALAMPIGFVWIILAGRLGHALIVGRIGAYKGLLLGWLGLWSFGTLPLSTFATQLLESQNQPYRPDVDLPLDVVVVLGGSTVQGRGRAQLSDAGDRVLLGAELFLAGKTKQLVTTGESITAYTKSQSSPADHTVEIWTKLGIPREAIRTCSGRNTYEEIQNLKQQLHELRGPRIGLLTSAIHLPRAMRLADSAGLDVVPIAADFRGADVRISFIHIIPQAGPIYRLQAIQLELMGRLVGR